MEEAYPQSGSWSTWFLVKLEFGILVFEEKGKAPGRGGGNWVFYGWVCAARDSKLAPCSKKNFP